MIGVQSRYSTAICFSCMAETEDEAMSADHLGLCECCAADLQATIDADAAEELLSDDAIISELLKCGETELADAAERSDRMGAAS